MGKTLINMVTLLMLGASLLFPKLGNAQTRPINQPTPWTKIGDFFQRPYINYYGDRKDSSDFYGSNGVDWDTLKTQEEKTSLLQEILPVEYNLRQSQNYQGYSVLQAFINMNGISNIGAFVRQGNTYDSTGNAYFNMPMTQVAALDGNENLVKWLGGVLTGTDIFDENDWYLFDPSDSNKSVDPSNFTYLSFDTEAYYTSIVDGKNRFNFLDDLIKLKNKNGVKDTIMFKTFTWRNSPANTTLSLTAPGDTTIPYSDTLDLSNENLGDATTQTNLTLGQDFFLQAKDEYNLNQIKGEVYVKTTPTLEDTLYKGSSKDFDVKRKIVKELVEKNTVYNPIYPNGISNEHTIKKDSVYQTIKVRETTDVEDSKNNLPKDFEVSQNYPNPFNPSTTIEYQNKKYGDVKLNVYDALGRKLETITQEGVLPGKHKFNIDMSKYSSGVYLFEVSRGMKHKIIKGILQK